MEVVVSALCLALIVSAVASLLVNGGDTALQSQRQTALLEFADQQIEQIRQSVKNNPAGFAALATSAAPSATATNVDDPNHFWAADGGCKPTGSPTSYGEYYIVNDYLNPTTPLSAGSATGTEPAFSGCDSGAEPLVVTAGAIVPVSAGPYSVGGDAVMVDSYVTQTNVGCNTNIGGGTCGTDARRVTVAVVPTGTVGGGSTQIAAPIYTSTIFTNPQPTNAPNGTIGLTLGVSIG
jgi:hypothetical protein